MTMKKIIATLAILLGLTVMPASAQGLKFGVMGGFTRSSLSFDSEVLSTKGRYGWFFGPSVKINLPLFFAVDAAALYDQREVEINGDGVKVKQISIPINARMDYSLLGSVGVYAAIGPQFSFNVGSKDFSWTDKESYNSTFQLKKSAISMNFGFGAVIASKLEIGAAYNVELGNTSDISWSTVTDKSTYDNSKMNMWRVHATYYF